MSHKGVKSSAVILCRCSEGQEEQKEQTYMFSSSKVSFHLQKSWLIERIFRKEKEILQKKLKPRRESEEERNTFHTNKRQPVGYSQDCKLAVVEFCHNILDQFQDRRGSHKASPCMSVQFLSRISSVVMGCGHIPSDVPEVQKDNIKHQLHLVSEKALRPDRSTLVHLHVDDVQ